MPTLDLTQFKPAPATIADADQISSGFTAVETVVNGLTAVNIAANAAIPPTALTGSLTDGDVLTSFSGVPTWTAPTGGGGGGGGTTIPSGFISPYAGLTTPNTDWLLCDGTAVSRATYAALYIVVGNTYGAGDGVNTFNLPDLRGRMPVGKGTHTDVLNPGQTENAVIADRRPKHKHTVAVASEAVVGTQQPFTSGSSSGGITNFPTGAGSESHVYVGPQTNVPVDAPAYLVINYLIKT